MILSRLGLAATLGAAGVARKVIPRLEGVNFATVSREFVSDSFAAAMDGLRANAPEMVDVLDLGQGRSRLVPRYVANGFCCRGHAVLVYSHVLTGFAIKGARAALAGTPLVEDGLAVGVVHYLALPRPDNRGRSGPHANLWFVDHEGHFQTFEPGDGEEHEFNETELASVFMIYAQ